MNETHNRRPRTFQSSFRPSSIRLDPVSWLLYRLWTHTAWAWQAKRARCRLEPVDRRLGTNARWTGVCGRASRPLGTCACPWRCCWSWEAAGRAVGALSWMHEAWMQLETRKARALLGSPVLTLGGGCSLMRVSVRPEAERRPGGTLAWTTEEKRGSYARIRRRARRASFDLSQLVCTNTQK